MGFKKQNVYLNQVYLTEEIKQNNLEYNNTLFIFELMISVFDHLDMP